MNGHNMTRKQHDDRRKAERLFNNGRFWARSTEAQKNAFRRGGWKEIAEAFDSAEGFYFALVENVRFWNDPEQRYAFYKTVWPELQAKLSRKKMSEEGCKKEKSNDGVTGQGKLAIVMK